MEVSGAIVGSETVRKKQPDMHIIPNNMASLFSCVTLSWHEIICLGLYEEQGGTSEFAGLDVGG